MGENGIAEFTFEIKGLYQTARMSRLALAFAISICLKPIYVLGLIKGT